MNKTMINGTIYQISGGKTLVDGTIYAITSGKTFIDGVVRTLVSNVQKIEKDEETTSQGEYNDLCED